MNATSDLFQTLFRGYFRTAGNRLDPHVVVRIVGGLANHRFQQTGFDAGRDALIKLLGTASKHRQKEIKALLHSADKTKFFKGIQIVAHAIALAWEEDESRILLLIFEHLRQSAITGESVIDFVNFDLDRANRFLEEFQRECQGIIGGLKKQEFN